MTDKTFCTKKYIIEVKGDVVTNGLTHYAQNWVCCGMSSPITDDGYSFDKKAHAVVSNLVLNENIRAVPYAIYLTKQGIAAYDTGNLSAYPGYGAAWEYYKENISKISNLLKLNVPKEVEQTFYNGLYTDVFSILELFLSDFILCMIYSNETVYDNAVQYYKDYKTEQGCDVNKISDIERNVHDFFFEGVVYHRFDKVEQMFKQILEIDFPKYKKLSDYLHRRNNIVHRFSLSNRDRMRMTNSTVEDVTKLIYTSNSFVDSLIMNVNKVYKNV